MKAANRIRVCPISPCVSRRLLLFTIGALALVWVGCASSTSNTKVGPVQVHSVRLEYNNAHVVTRNGHSFLIDSGLPEDASELDAELQDAGYDPASFEAIVVTHGHADHAGGAHYFAEKYGTPIVAGKGDQPMMAAGRNDVGEFCPTDSTGEDRLEEDRGRTYSPTTADTWIEGKADLLPLTQVEGQIVTLPSHTPGSLAVISGDAVFVGDLFRGAIVGSSAEVHFYMCDLEANRKDIQKLLTMAPNATTFFPGHFGPVDRDEVEDLVEEMAEED